MDFTIHLEHSHYSKCLQRKMAFNKKWALLTLTVLSFYVFFYINDISTGSFLASRPHPLRHEALLDYGKTVILIWTPFVLINWMENGWVFEGTTYYFSEENCIFTFDRDYMNVAKAVVFHWRDIDFHDLPDVKYINQSWVLFNSESASNNVLYLFDKMLKRIEPLMDLVMSYRRDSDIYAPYGGYVKKGSSESSSVYIAPKAKSSPTDSPSSSILSTSSPSSPPLPDLSTKNGRIVWMASNCETPGKRELFVQELSKHIPVDIYGKCGKVFCWPRDAQYCMAELSANYTFYLSFENSICKDYATEKVFRALRDNLIPVVFGGANYTSILPPNSFIDALSFTSPYHLAVYLNRVKSTKSLLASYYEWKKDYEVISSLRSYFFTSLCKTFSSGKPPVARKRDLYRYFIEDDNCKSYHLPARYSILNS